MVLSLSVALALAGSSAIVTGFDNRPHNPLADAKGKVVALVFITHDCPVCNTYAPELARIAKVCSKSGAILDLVYTEPDLTLTAAKAHAKAYNYKDLHLYLDPAGQLAKLTGAKITPEAAVYDRSGREVYLGRIDDLFVAYGKQRSKATQHDLRGAIESALARRPVSNPRTRAIGCYIATGTS